MESKDIGIGKRLARLSTTQKRALLNEVLTNASRATGDRRAGADGVDWDSGNSHRLHIDEALLESAPLYTRFVNPHLGYYLSRLGLDKEFVRGEGCYLYDREGRGYLDLTSNYGALAFGFNHPFIWDAVERARRAQEPSLVSLSLGRTAGKLAERLVGLAPPGLRYVTFANSGAEAVEVAIKLCRSAKKRPGILSTHNSFHGKTLGAVSATGNPMYQKAFGRPAPGFHYVPFGDLEALRSALGQGKGYLAAFLVEPIQGEGGIVEPPPGYLAEASRICQSFDTLLVVDEVQTGLGRTGALFACQEEGVRPDVLLLAKALGGGLVSIGACLCAPELYTQAFALLHSSTFAGNGFACEVALAALDLLERDDRAIIRNVAASGERLKASLLDLQRRHPDLVRSVRGRGYMLGLQLDLDGCRRGMLTYLSDQHAFGYLVASYLLNVEGIRLAPTRSAGDVLRIQPPLIAGERESAQLVAALDRVLDILASGNTARLVSHFVNVDPQSVSVPGQALWAPRPARETHAVVEERDGRFAFLLHLETELGFLDLDPSLAAFTQDQLGELKARMADVVAPAPVAEAFIQSPTGQRAYGEFIMIPYTARDLLTMASARAISEIEYAARLAESRGARVLGLGGYTSIVTQGGLALANCGLPALTTGSAYTVVSGREALVRACQRRGRPLSGAVLAVVGAGGSLGRAISILMAEEVAGLILLGSPEDPARTHARLRDVAAAILQRLSKRRAETGFVPTPGTLAEWLESAVAAMPSDATRSDVAALVDDPARNSGRIMLGTGVEHLDRADLVVTATSNPDVMIGSRDLKPHAIVCELSRPFNVAGEIRQSRPDVLVIDGGLVRVPGLPDVGHNRGLESGVTYACVAETVLLALEHSYRNTGLGVSLGAETIRELEALGVKHGFTTVA